MVGNFISPTSSRNMNTLFNMFKIRNNRKDYDY